MRTLLVLSCVLLLTACGEEEPAAVEPVVDRPLYDPSPIDFNKLQQNPTFEALREYPKAEATNDERFHAALLAAVKAYGDYGNLDDHMRWAPTLCRIPPVQIRESASEHEDTHGRKLYWLHAKDRPAYLAASKGKAQPVGQVLVKEAFHVVAGEGEVKELGGQPVYTTVMRDGKPFHAGEREALYIMLKLDPKTEGTDGGWVYGTVTANDLIVTSAGKVASCMACHTENTTDRMFGLKQR
ncbi:MAG: cytochrome P460 family protein [Planctomycetota bacterium]|nr:cytochrome P460 family protein [Planctomycetota bacterium]